MLDLSPTSHIIGATHWFREVNQLYRPSAEIPAESQYIVFASNSLKSPKFLPIALKEWFSLVKINGYLIVDYREGEGLNWQTIEDDMWWLHKTQYRIIYHDEISELNSKNISEETLRTEIKTYSNQNGYSGKPAPRGTTMRFVCQKNTSFQTPNDSIDKWSFGILSNGQREEWTEQVISSIRKQKIPNYEILVCGKYGGDDAKDLRLIPFSDRDSQGWITKKKNLIARESRYDNLCILHNRMLLAKGWYAGMKKWGNTFEVLNTIQTQKINGKRGNSWEETTLALYRKLSLYIPKTILHFTADLDYKDWGRYVMTYGQAIIIKKRILLQIPQNETLYWGMPEDHAFSYDLIDNGYILRLNPYSEFINLDTRNWGTDTRLLFSPTARGKEVGPFIKVVFRKTMLIILSGFNKLTLRT